jgi:apolipoprotein N-acyltransferase
MGDLKLKDGPWLLLFLTALCLVSWAIVFFGVDGHKKSSILVFAMALLFGGGFVFTVIKARKASSS